MSTINEDSSGTSRRLERILTLFQNVGTLDGRVNFERSLKVARGRLLESRFLLGINRRKLGASKDVEITRIAANIGMPCNLLALFESSLVRANHVYFGVEKDEDRLLLKAYLEFRDEIERQIGTADPAGIPFGLYTGFKWEAFFPDRYAITQYAWYPSIAIPAMLQLMQSTLPTEQLNPLVETVRRVLIRASELIPHSQIQYLDVTEEGTLRKSFDVNIYKSGLRINDVYPYLLDSFRHLEIPVEYCDKVLGRIKSDRIGHLAGGIDRENHAFFTIYYGAKHLYGNQLRSACVGNRA